MPLKLGFPAETRQFENCNNAVNRTLFVGVYGMVHLQAEL